MKTSPNLTLPKTNCCGCGVCKYICPVDAIEMVEDEEGFLYPKINEEKCIKCYKCVNSCIFKTRKNENI